MNKNLTQIDDETVKEIIQNGRGAEKDKHTLFMQVVGGKSALIKIRLPP